MKFCAKRIEKANFPAQKLLKKLNNLMNIEHQRLFSLKNLFGEVQVIKNKLKPLKVRFSRTSLWYIKVQGWWYIIILPGMQESRECYSGSKHTVYVVVE